MVEGTKKTEDIEANCKNDIEVMKERKKNSTERE